MRLVLVRDGTPAAKIFSAAPAVVVVVPLKVNWSRTEILKLLVDDCSPDNNKEF